MIGEYGIRDRLSGRRNTVYFSRARFSLLLIEYQMNFVWSVDESHGQDY